MKRLILALLLASTLLSTDSLTSAPAQEETMISYIVDPLKQDIRLYWKDDSGHVFGNFERLRNYLDHQQRRLVFAANGGMFAADRSPIGLFIQAATIVRPIDTASGNGNFYLKPNGVFYITKDGKAAISTTEAFRDKGDILLATQSGPMLLIDGAIHPAFREGSTNLNIRNGVGLLPDNRLVFAMSKKPVNFYDLASWFKARGCQNALYLDGFVSRTWLPEKGWTQTDGDLGVLIGVSEKLRP